MLPGHRGVADDTHVERVAAEGAAVCWVIVCCCRIFELRVVTEVIVWPLSRSQMPYIELYSTALVGSWSAVS